MSAGRLASEEVLERCTPREATLIAQHDEAVGVVAGYLEVIGMTYGADQICVNHDYSPSLAVELSRASRQPRGSAFMVHSRGICGLSNDQKVRELRVNCCVVLQV